MAGDGRKKYLFDTDFTVDDGAVLHAKTEAEADAANAAANATDAAKEAEAEVVEEAPPPPPTFSEEDLAQAREEGRQAGRDEATRDMASAMEQRLADTLEAINTQVTGLFDAYARDQEKHSRDAVGVATVIVRKLFPALNMDKAMDEIEHMIVEAMKRTSSSPALIVRVSETMHSAVESKTADLAALRGREGTLNVIADANIAEGDITIEWDGGGMARNSSLIWQEIDEIIERNLGQKLETYASSEAQAEPQAEQLPEQLVVNPAQVGKNEESPVESPSLDDDAPQD